MDMSFYSPRKLKFKAWNEESGLLMRLNSIDCVKGELVKKGHILLQFTGLHDKQDEEVYDMDVLLWNSEKFIIYWSEKNRTWKLSRLDADKNEDLQLERVIEMNRLCSYFESNRKATS
jgi:hypothetical protein